MIPKRQQTMQAVEITRFGKPDVLMLTDCSVPDIREGEVLIRVHAAGVNRPDILQRLGKYPPPPGVTDIPGLEVAGEIVESRSDLWKPGDRVCALLAGGGYAEYAIAPAGQCLPIPKGLSMAEAAALPEAVFTVWNNLFLRGALKEGERVLIHGGASGIGTTAIQMAKAFGATVAATAGSEEKCAACKKLGADLVIDYKDGDFAEAVRGAWGPDSIDVVLDMVGGDILPKNLSIMATDGRHVSIAFLEGFKAEIDIRMVMNKRLILTGSTLRGRPVAEKTTLARDVLAHVWPKIEAGLIRPVIYRAFPLAQAAEAHRTLEAGEHIGKIVLSVKT